MSNPTRIGQEAPDLKTPSSPSRITPTRAIDDAEKQMTKPPEPKYPYAVDDDGVARVGYVAVDPAQHNKATELQLWPLFGTIDFCQTAHARLPLPVAQFFCCVHGMVCVCSATGGDQCRTGNLTPNSRFSHIGHHPPGPRHLHPRHLVEQRVQRGGAS